MTEEPRHPPAEAIAVETYVEAVRGQWEVSVVVVFADEVVRNVIGTYHNRRLAEVAATWIRRAAQRDVPMARPRTLHAGSSCNKEPER